MKDWRPEAFMCINNIRKLLGFKRYQKNNAQMQYLWSPCDIDHMAWS